MQISARTITALQKVLTGDPLDHGGRAVAPYRKCPDLMRFFHEFGFNDVYTWGGGQPTRWVYAEERIRDLSGKADLRRVIETAVDPLHFAETEFPVTGAVEHLNRYLARDGFELRPAGDRYRLHATGASLATASELESAVEAGSMEFVREQIDKCQAKLGTLDHDGAVTNARSMLEAVLLEIEKRTVPPSAPYDGDLVKLYRRVQKALNLDPARPDIPDSLKQVLTGLVSLVNGIAAARNQMGDAHARKYKPMAHHARAVINGALTVADFVLASEARQRATIPSMARSSE
jgi:hypothetical protein